MLHLHRIPSRCTIDGNDFRSTGTCSVCVAHLRWGDFMSVSPPVMSPGSTLTLLHRGHRGTRQSRISARMALNFMPVDDRFAFTPLASLYFLTFSMSEIQAEFSVAGQFGQDSTARAPPPCTPEPKQPCISNVLYGPLFMVPQVPVFLCTSLHSIRVGALATIFTWSRWDNGWMLILACYSARRLTARYAHSW
jgi:hypothetical protein